MDAYPKPLHRFARWVPTLGYLLDYCNLKFLCSPLAAHTFSLCSILWIRSVYDSRGDPTGPGMTYVLMFIWLPFIISFASLLST